MTSAADSIQVPLHARIRIGHAVLQVLADDAGIDVLHIKGYAVQPGLYRAGRSSTDVDLLVRPAHATRLLDVIAQHGWRRVTSFRSGSIFEHAAVAWHDTWGYADVHRVMPGVGLDGAAAFERLWATSEFAQIAGVPCRVPSPRHQAMVVVLHDARTPSRAVSADVRHVREHVDDDERAALRAEARAFDAELAWAAATDTLDAFRGHPQYPLWAAVRSGAGRVELLRARVRSARGPLAKAGIVAGAAWPNRDHLRMSLGREPTAADIAGDLRERMRDAVRGVTGGITRIWARRSRSRHRRGKDGS